MSANSTDRGPTQSLTNGHVGDDHPPPAQDANDRIRLLNRIATDYYEQGRTIAQIAAALHMEEAEITGLLIAARGEGVVQVKVRTPWKTDAHLEEELRRRFSLKTARVVVRESRSESELLETLGLVAAQHLSGLLQPTSVIGISWGSGLHHMIQALPPMSLPDAEVVQLLGATGSEGLATDGPMLAQLLSNRLGCHCRYLHAPLVVESEAGRNALLQERHIRDTLQRGEEANIAVVGIGATTPELSSLVHAGYLNEQDVRDLQAAGVVGDICAQHYSATGEWLNVEVNRRVVGLNLHALSRIPTVIGVAGGIAKAATLFAALQGKYVDVLVTDDQAARAVLALADGVAPDAAQSRAPAKADVRASLKSIWKVFDGVPVLRGVDIELRRGQIHAILGGNGSGKSTLMKILSGVYTADAGSIELDGTPVVIGSPSVAHRLGIYLVPQEPKVFPHLTVIENLLLGTEMSAGAAMEQIRTLTKELGFEANLTEEAGNLSIANQQLVEIIRGLLRDARVLILDEPTSTLTSREVDVLFSRLRHLAQRGIGIFFISHRLNEILSVSDWVSVLRDGTFVLSAPTASVKARDLIRAMLPEGAASTTSDVAAESRGGSHRSALSPEPVLVVRALSGDMFHDVSFNVHAGEVVGLAGLVGAGRSELARAIVGIDRSSSGSVTVNGVSLDHRSPRTCQDKGLVYVPEDRHSHGIFLGLPNLHTMTAGILHTLCTPFLASRRERAVGAQFIEQLRIKVTGPDQVSRTLSGGNQQKTVLAKSLVSKPRVVILDEPTRGIDAQARVDVYTLIRQLTEQGLGVLLISSDFEEVIQLSDRVLVMYHGTLVEELPHSQCQIERVTSSAFGLKESRAA